MDIRTALKKFDGLPQYFWKLLNPEKDEFTRMAQEHCNGGYFVRARKGVKIAQPVQSCMFIKGHGAGQIMEQRMLGAAVGAPAGPDVEHEGLPLERRGVDGGAAKQIVTLPVRQGAPCDGLILAVGVVAKAEPEQGTEPQGEHERHEQAQTGVHKDSCSRRG